MKKSSVILLVLAGLALAGCAMLPSSAELDKLADDVMKRSFRDEAMAKVLIVAQDQVLIENLKRELPQERSFKVSVAASGFEAGIQAESFHPDCMIVDFSVGKLEALQICQNLRKNADFTEIILIALLPDDGNVMSFDRSSINETFKKPFDARLLAERLRTLIGAKKELV